MNILGDFYEKLPGDKSKRRLGRDLEADESGWIEGAEIEKDDPNLSGGERRQPLFLWLYLVLGIVFLLLFSKLWALQISRGAHFRYLAEGNRIRTVNIPAQRGIIYDRDGKLITRNVAKFNIEIYPIDMPRDKEERERLYKNIARLIEVPLKNIKKAVEKDDLNPFEPVVVKEKVERKKALILKEKLIEVPAVSVAESSTRDYEHRWGLSHILGYVGKISKEELEKKLNDSGLAAENASYHITDYVGKVGLEAALEQELKGQNGKQQVEVDALGKVVQVIAEREAISGNNLVATIDLKLQEKIYRVLKKTVARFQGKGVVIAANPQNGEILSMVSLPDYNNNIFTKITGDEFTKEYQRLIKDQKNPMFNRAVAGLYPPGSTIKPIAAAAALQEKIIDINTHIFDPGVIEVPNKYDPDIVYRFSCWKKDGHGWVNVVRAIKESCNTFFYGVGGGYDKIPGLGVKKIEKYYSLFGFGEKAKVDLTGVANGLIPNPSWKEKVKKEPWYLGDNYMLTIGQGDLLVTPLQLLMATSVIANRGELVKPQLVKKIISPDGETVKEFGKKVVQKRFISAKNIDIVRQGMREVVASGTARSLNNLPVSSAGKTGTAKSGTPKDYHAWYTSFAPYENPEIALVVLVENAGEGSEIAVPVTREILNWYFNR